MFFKKLFHDFLVWRVRNISNKNFIFLLSFLVGICGGLAAVLLKTTVHTIGTLLINSFNNIYESYWFFIFPLIGILLTILYKYAFMKGKIGGGIPNLLHAITHKSGLVEKDKMYSHLISSSVTVGFGGSVGLEAPIVTTGAALGSNLGRWFHLGHKKRTLLIGCGAAAGIAGIFNSPIAGVIFTLEVLMLELSIPAYIPLLIAAVTAALISKYLTGGEILFNFQITDTFQISEVPLYIMLGIICGLLSVYFTRLTFRIESDLRHFTHPLKRALIGGSGLGLLIFLFPPLYGEGYVTLTRLIDNESAAIISESFFLEDNTNQWVFLLFMAGVLAFKVFATSFTIGAGGNGGVFAPSMFVGGLSGFVMARFLNLTGFLSNPLSEKNFILVGMAGVCSGVLHAPLTAIFIIAEITGGYILMLPLMIVSAIAFATTMYFEPHSLYTKQLALRGLLVFHNRDKTVLTLLRLQRLIETDLVVVHPEAWLEDLVKAVSRSRRNIFPVVDEHEKIHGVILLDDIRELMFKPKQYKLVQIKDLMHAPSDYVYIDEDMDSVMKKFDTTGDWNLPVINHDRKYIGFLSKSKIFNHYRTQLIKQGQEDEQIID
ncbi:MAG: chloride channel protein [Bacteroidia bacterium]